MNIANNRQCGATLITALIMLIVLTLLVVSGIRSSSTNLRIAGNMQMQEEAIAAAQLAIEKAISSDPFDTSSQIIGNYTVTFGLPVCQYAKQAVKSDPLPDECRGEAGTVSCFWTAWDISASAVDTSTGSMATIHQGIGKLVNRGEASANCGV